MAATSPGSRKSKSSVSSIDEVTGSPPSGLLLKVDHFGETKSATSYPTTERFINGLRFRVKGSHKSSLSITYAILPGMKPTPLTWRMCCNTIYSIGAQHVTYHNLTDSDRSLSAVVAGYTKPNVDGLIIINSINSISLSNEFISEEGGIPSSSPPVYVVSSHDGEKLKEFLAVNQESVEVKVLVESTVDPGAPHWGRSQSRSDVQEHFNLYDEIIKYLHIGKKERIIASDPVNQSNFQFIFSCFQNYEGQIKRDSHDKVIKMLTGVTDEVFSKDFLFYFLLAYRFILYAEKYGRSDTIHNYLRHCILKLEEITDVQTIANVLNKFFQRKDFFVQFTHGTKPNVSVFQLLYDMSNRMSETSNKLHSSKDKSLKTSSVIYHRMLWIALTIRFGLEVKEEPTNLAVLWRSKLLSDKIQKELQCSDEIVQEFKKGFKLLRALNLPESSCFDGTSFAVFLHPLHVETLYISHIMSLIQAAETYFSQTAALLIQFLPPLRSQYQLLFSDEHDDWKRFSAAGTKIGVYKEALKFMDFIHSCASQLNKDEHNSKIAYIIQTEIEKWLELLVNSVDMYASNAAEYYKILYTELSRELRIKFRSVVANSIHACGMEFLKKHFSVSQFYVLFKPLKLWRFQFVEEFLNNYNVPEDVDLKDGVWQPLLDDIINKFPDVHCRSCIIQLMDRIGRAYKKPDSFIVDLMNMNIPDLMKIYTNDLMKIYTTEDDPNVEQLFINMLRSFIQRNALNKMILYHVQDILKLVKPGNHLQSLILATIQKEIVLDNEMIKKLDSNFILKPIIIDSVKAACNTLSTLSQLSEINKFYWHFIALCCNCVQPNPDNLDDFIINESIIDQLIKILQAYYRSNKKISKVTHELPHELSHISNSDVKNYFKWILNMQNILADWQQKFKTGEYNYDDVFTYAMNVDNITKFAEAVHVEHLTYSSEEIFEIKEKYSTLYADLCLLLVVNSKNSGWCTLVEILSSYDIEFSPTIQTMLDTHLILPGINSVATKNVQQRLNQPGSQLELEPEMILIFRKSMTWNVLHKLFDNLKLFLKPILPHLKFLVHFHLRKSKMFKKQLLFKLPSSQKDVDASSSMNLPFDSEQSAAEKLEEFAKALQQTKEFILSLIRGMAKYEDIFAAEESFDDERDIDAEREFDVERGFDAEREFKIMCEFSEFQEVLNANEEGMQGIKHMLELFQYSQQISQIPNVCEQYGLHQCSNDPRLGELIDIVDSVKTKEDRAQITGQIANSHMQKIREILKLSDSPVAKKCLKIFPAVANCAEFYQFIKEKGFAVNRTAFSSQMELITAQLQHEDYNEKVLNHLMPAFQYITPFLDTEQNLTELMDKILKLFKDGVGFGRDSRKDFCQLETVSSNIAMIQLWFSRTEGDTLENVSKELECILSTGRFQLNIMPKKIVGTIEEENEETTVNTSVLLHYEPAREIFFQRQRQHFISKSVSLLSPSHTKEPLSCGPETWNNDQIDDFVRKLGFLEAQNADMDKSVKFFQQINQTAQNLFKTLLKLRDLGHPDYMTKEETISCSTELHSAESMVIDAQKILKEWKTKIKELHKSYNKLLFFSVSKVLSLHNILKESIFSTDKMIEDIGFLFENSPKAIEMLKTATQAHASCVENDLAFAQVGKYLDQLCDDPSVAAYFLRGKSKANFSKMRSLSRYQETVHSAPNYDNGQLLLLLIQLYDGIPESYEVFHCDEDSIEEDLKLFLDRASKFRFHMFTILGVNMLPYKLQELIIHHHSQETDQTIESTISLHYIETADSVLHEMPWVAVKEHKDNGPDLLWDTASKKYFSKGNDNFDLELVYGLAGDGKTHYIKKELFKRPLAHYLIISVNESFTPHNAILKLRSLPSGTSCKIFFNFTIAPSTNSEEEKKYKKLMNILAWFFFKLLVYEYVEDPGTGMAFRLPGGHCWKIFVEVPSLSKVTHGNEMLHLKWIQDEIPIFRLVGKPVLIRKPGLIEKSSFYDIDSSVQLVCKYLNAYENRRNLKQGINRLYKETEPPVKFGDDPDLTDKQCYTLLRKYMPPHVTENKILQQLFVKYMERRCKFLDNFPGYCYNSGLGAEFDHSQLDHDELKEMVSNKAIVLLRGKYYTNTKYLGEVLMETMLQEVSDFCKIDYQQNWAVQAHQQLIYEVRSGGGSIQLLTATPDKLDEKKIKRFKALGIEIPSMKELLDRETLDAYLSSALDVPLKDGRLQDIDYENYVLTVDYTIKMLSIHERRECGIPVIIEGETGVGKTALINMLSILWNHALRNELRTVKEVIRDMLLRKSLDLETSNLRKILQKEHDTTDWQFDKELDVTEKCLSEEDLLPLTEMDHTVSGGETVPYYQFINEKLLEVTENKIILELLDVNMEATKDDFSKYQNRKFNRRNSFVAHVTNSIETDASAQATAKLLCTLLNGNLIPTFYKLNIHAALSPKEIQEFFVPIMKLADYLREIHSRKQIEGMDKPPVVTVFLDEVNTSSCMGLFKEMIIDKTFEGKPIPPNIFLVAACNPHRGNSLAVHANTENKAETWVKGSYYVQKLHPTMRFLMWDYGSLNDEQESHYIKAKMVMVNIDFDIPQNIIFSEVVVKCQNLVREFAYEQLKSSGIEDSEAKLRATSCVSQRDIQRVFTFYSWITRTYLMMRARNDSQKKKRTATTKRSIYAKHPTIHNNSTIEQMRERALLVALGLVYYVRLDNLYRERFAHELDNEFSLKFQAVFTEELDFCINELSLPNGIAKTEALKENLFATIICTVTKTPLIIVGAPGSSKTLSFNLTISNLKGLESKKQLFRNTEIFKSLDPHFYQCSRRTTSVEIETVFQRAINRQRSHNSFSMPIRCVVFMDEAGLPEDSHESLKALHYHLDQQEVAFVAITNEILDAAKTNRAISLFRPTASKKDLQTLAKGCLCANPDTPPPGFKNDLDKIVKLCDAYCTIMEDKCFEKFFGLRDFIYFINYIRQKRKIGITPELVLQSLERNFNGIKGFENICSTFLQKMGEKQEKLEPRSIIAILNSSLADKPYCINHQDDTVSTTIGSRSSSPSHDGVQNEVRYKLIIDPSEDESITRLLFMFGILQRENTRTYMCSDFSGDGQLQKINTIAAIRHSAIAGHTVVMSQTDDIHESFYDLFNQRFRRIDDPEGGPRYFTNISIGAHLKPSRVDQNFQCIVVVKESEIKNTPAPFLNRFEKYFISHKNLLTLSLDELPPCLRVMANVIHKKVKKFYSLLDPSSFYGSNKETVSSLLLSVLPRPGHEYEKLSKSLVPTGSEVNSTNSFFITNGSSSNKVLLLQNVVRCLHKFGGFCYMESSMEELEHDANSIIQLLTNTGPKFCGVAKELETCDANTLSQWIAGALDLIYEGKAPPDIDMLDDDMCDNDNDYDNYYDDDDDNDVNNDDSDNDNGDDVFVETLRASDGACMVTAVIAQWILRFICKKLMQLLTPESTILNRKCIPISYLETYLNHQTHFSIKELIDKQTRMLNQCEDNENNKVATKIICYTRSTPAIHQLPAVYPSSTVLSPEELQYSCNINLICENVESLFLCKLSSISSQTAFKLQLQMFVASPKQTIFVLIINMQETKYHIINHIRIMIEEAEHVNGKLKKLFVLLLHFPAMMFYDPCYPSLFLCGWEHYYIDAIDRTSSSSLVDTKEWFRKSCLKIKDDPSYDSVLQSLLNLLRKQESILIIASRILLNIDSDELSLDSKVDYLKNILFVECHNKSIADVLCQKFMSYWTPAVMAHHLEQAARFSISRESTLNISDSVDSMYKSAFYNFIAYMLYHISKSHNLDVLLKDLALLDLFLKLLEVYTIPKLAEIKAFNNTWNCRVYAAGGNSYVPQFPFFVEVSGHICKMIETSMAEVLQENENTVIDSQRLLKMLYDRVCNKASINTEREMTIGAKYMSAIAISKMRNDESLWEKYYNDFICRYVHLSADRDSLGHKLLDITFCDIFKSCRIKAIVVHCYIHLNQLDLAKIVALLKSLGQLKVHKEAHKSLYPIDPESTFIARLMTDKRVTHTSVSKFVIESLFAVLVDTVFKTHSKKIQFSKTSSYRLSILQKWFNSYRDMMSIASLKKTLNSDLKDDCLMTQCHLMEVTFLILSFNQITDASAECAYVLASHLCGACFNKDFEFIDKMPLNLKQIVTSLNAMIEGPQFIELISTPLLYQKITEGLYMHFFPDSALMYSKRDIEFFLTFTNQQDTLKELIEPPCSDDQPQNPLNLSKLKIFLDRILCKGWSKSGAVANPLDFYKLEICICVGETLVNRSPESIPNEYVPLHLQQTTKEDQNPLMHQTLMHLYFYAVLEKLQTNRFSPATLVNMIRKTEKKLTEVSSKAEKVIAVVEKQALLEALIQAVANNFELGYKDKIENLSMMSERLNSLIKDESHCDILLMHLIKKYHGPQGVLNLLSDKYKKWWKYFTFFTTIKEKLKGSHSSSSHQFQFINDSSSTKHQLTGMYRDIHSLLCSIAEGSSTQKTKAFLRYINAIKSKNKRYNIKSTVRMMIWLCVYYDFYCEKKPGAALIQLFEDAKGDLGLSDEHLHVLNCFLDPTMMLKDVEVPNPSNLNAKVLEYVEEGKISKQPSNNEAKRDPIWEFFNPDDANFDPSDNDLRHALANMIAVVFSLPSRGTHACHLWYHMFAPGDLENSYLTGFMYPSMVGKGGLMYDCGCMLNECGSYGRPDYTLRDTLSLNSWYLLLWSNFGAFCVGLLTQPTAHQMKGNLLSDWLSLRHYCMKQLRTVWSSIQQNMSLGDEERSFFIMRSMYQLFTLFQENAFSNSKGVFTDLKALADYEKIWHQRVYREVKDNLKDELEKYSSQSIWTLPIMKTFRILEQHYPHPATENDYIKSLVDAIEAKNCNHTHLFVLHQFTLKKQMLHLGGALLPDLVEFYQWIHTHMSHLVTYEKAKEMNIGKVISLSAKRYSQEVGDKLKSLFDRIISKYNDYLTVNGGNVGRDASNRAAKPANVHYISKDTPLIKLLSLADTDQNDWLYIVLMDIIQKHNDFLNSIFEHAASSDCHFKMCLPESPQKLHPTEVTSQNCIIPSNETDEKHFVKLINSHYIYSGFQSTPVLDLLQLERAVVKFYIAGKSLIMPDSSIRSIFRFRNSPAETIISGNNPGCATDLSAIAQELSSSYKETLDEKESHKLEFHFRTASYHTITEIVNGLRTATGHLIQDILKGTDKEWTPSIVLIAYLEKIFNKDHHVQVFGEIGIHSVSDMQRRLLGDIEMKKLFKCLELFVDWLQGGLYDFVGLPVSMFKHMSPKDSEAIMGLHTKYSSTKIDNLLIDLNDFEKSLNQAESDLITKVDSKSSIVDILFDKGLCISTDKFVSLIPKSILPHHYVYFRMTLRRLKISVTEMVHSQPQSSPNKWSELIEALWKHLSHFKYKEKPLLYDETCLKLDCETLQYVDGQESIASDSITWPHQSTSEVEDSAVKVGDTSSEILQKLQENPEVKKVVMKTLVTPTSLLSKLQPPSEKALEMTSQELCQWLRNELKISDTDIECFEKEEIDGSLLANFDHEELEELGIKKSFVRIKIITKFRDIS